MVLCDSHNQRGLPIPLTSSEADALDFAIFARRNANELPFPQDPSQRLLESLNAQLQRVVINALAGQTLYASITIRQGKHTREVDMRLSEALTVAIRIGAPIFITRSLFEAATTLDLTTRVSPPPSQEVENKGKEVQSLGREERLQLEEDVRAIMAVKKRSHPERFSARLWTWLLENLTGTRDGVPAAELRNLDIATTFSIREVIWDEQPMIAIRLPEQQESPDQRETAWLLIRPALWKKITHPKRWNGLRNPVHNEEPIPFPDGLPLQIQQQVEKSLARIVEHPEVRTALLFHPQGTLSAWKGQDTQETVEQFSREFIQNHMMDMSVTRQFGKQMQRTTIVYSDKRPGLAERPEGFGGVEISAIQYDWRIVIIFAENASHAPIDGKDEMHQHIRQMEQELSDILTQSMPD